MKRRQFIKTSSAGTAFLATSGIWGLNKTFAANPENIKYCFQSEREIPVAYQVDVVVIGGSTAGVAAAVSASDTGASVFLAAQEPYLGEDVCGTFRLWNGDTAGADLQSAPLSCGSVIRFTLSSSRYPNKFVVADADLPANG